MRKLFNSNDKYREWIIEISKDFKVAQIKAATKVNSEMLNFYFRLGEKIHHLKREMNINNELYSIISKDLKKELPDIKSFSPTNLKYMQYFYELYSSPQLVDLDQTIFNIPWGHHRFIIDKCFNNPQKALFFVHKTVENNWSRNVLLNFLDTKLFERDGTAITNFSSTLPVSQGDLAQQITKDPYNFNFLTITEDYNEKELKDGLINNIQKFLLELGSGFAFIGREYRLVIGDTEKFIDLLFYHTILHCYVVVEVKTSKFDSDQLGQLGTYVTAVNHLLKGNVDNSTIGLLICKSKDNVLAKYSLESSNLPLGISEYELSNLIPEKYKGSLPTIDEIEEELKDKFIR